MSKSTDLSWGCPVVVRQALSEILNMDGNNIFYTPCLCDMGYTPHLGRPVLIEQLKDLAERQSGHRPKHLFITNGATGAVNATLYALRTQNSDWVVIDDRYYPMYPAIVGMTDMIAISASRQTELIKMGCTDRNFITLVASPSNPDGAVCPFRDVDIWDSAYSSKVYGSPKFSHVPKSYKVMCGSLGKSLGLTGLRLGWVSTDDDGIASSLKNYIVTTYVGLSGPSMEISQSILSNLNQDRFERVASSYIDNNREEVQRLVTKFGQGNVPIRGMFATLELGKAEKKALDKAEIKWQPGSSWGADDNWARLSLGQDRELTRKAIRAALKN